MTIHTNAGLAMLMQSAIAAQKTITAATNADPGVFTSVAHGYNDGDLVLLEIEGMPTLNNRVVQIYAKATDTFQLEDIDGASGIDTTNLGTFLSGTAKKLTMGISITALNDAPVITGNTLSCSTQRRYCSTRCTAKLCMSGNDFR